MPEVLPYVVEPMRLDDIEQVIEIEQVAFTAPWSARAYHYEVQDNKHSTMVVARPAPVFSGTWSQWLYSLKITRPGPVLGYAGFWLLVDDAHVCTIAVHPQWRQRGLGELLLLSLLKKGAAQGALRATLEVRVSNTAAQRLYLKYGFEIVSLQRRYYSDNNEDAYIMATPPLETAEFQANLHLCRNQLEAKMKAGAKTAPIGPGSPAG